MLQRVAFNYASMHAVSSHCEAEVMEASNKPNKKSTNSWRKFAFLESEYSAWNEETQEML